MQPTDVTSPSSAGGGGRSAKVVHIMEAGGAAGSTRDVMDDRDQVQTALPPPLSTWTTPPTKRNDEARLSLQPELANQGASANLAASANRSVGARPSMVEPTKPRKVSVMSGSSSIRRRSASQSLGASGMDVSMKKAVSEDRTINDQLLFYHSAASEDDIMPPIEGMTLNWCSHYSVSDNRTRLGADSWVDAVADEDAAAQQSAPIVEIPDTLALLFIRCLRDFYRTGVRFSCRDGLPKVGGGAGGGAQPSGVNPLSATASATTQENTHDGCVLRMKIQTVEDELRHMRELKRKGSTADLFDDAALLLPLSTGIGSSPSSSLSTSPLRRGQSILDASSTPTRRRSVLDLIVGGPASSPLADRHGRTRSSSDMGGSNSMAGTGSDAYDGNADSIPERHLVDRFTGPSLASLLAVTRMVFASPHPKLSSLKLLNLSGCNIGDDGCFVVLQAVRFGPMKGVQCLDLMYNQLTVRSALYMAVFLLLRPPVSIVDPDVNHSLRSVYEEANVPMDAKQKALQLIAAKRAAQRGMGGSASNRQGPPLFFPLFESWKQMVQEYFSKRHRQAATASLNSPSRMKSLKNVVQAAIGFGALKKKGSFDSSGCMTSSTSVNNASTRSGPFSGVFSTSANVPIVDEDAFVNDDGDEEGPEAFSSDDSDDEDLEEHMRELEALLAPAGRRATGDGDLPNARRGARLSTMVSGEMQRHLKELQDKEMKNAATDVVSLRLGWNDLDDEGLTMLSEWLAVQTFLLELNVSYNDAGDEGLMALRDAVRSTTSLVSLNTEGNPRATDSATAEVLRGALLYNRRMLQKQSLEG